MSGAYDYLKFRKKMLEELEKEKEKSKTSLSKQILSGEIAPVKEEEPEAWNPFESGAIEAPLPTTSEAPLPKTAKWLQTLEAYGKENPVDVGTLNDIEREHDKARADYVEARNKYYEELAEAKKKVEEEEANKKWFQKGAFEDGYQPFDVLKTLSSTTEDIRENMAAGILGMGEGIVDAGAYLVGGVGNLFSRDFGDDMRGFIAKDLYDEKAIAHKLVSAQNLLNPLVDTDNYSVLGEKSEELTQSGGQLAVTAALQMVGVPWFVTSGVTSFGGEVDNAFKNDATYGKAGFSGLVTAGSEILTEKLFGGSGLGEKGLINLEPLTKGISNRALKVLADFGIDMMSEGSEEVMSQFMSTLGQQLSYEREEDWIDLLSDRDAMDDYISQVADSLFGEEARSAYKDSFIGGAVLSGGANVKNVPKSIKTGRDYRTGLTENEQKVFEKEYSERLKQEAEGGKNLTDKQKGKIYDEVMHDLKEGGISIDTIESAIGGDTYKTYMDTKTAKRTMEDDKRALQEEAAKIEEIEVDKRSEEQKSRLTELRGKILDINRRSALPQYNQSEYDLKNQLSDSVQKMLVRQNGKNIQTDDFLLESYGEKTKRGQKYEADLTKYSDKQQEIVKKAIESGFLNNTRRTHALVDMIAKIHEDKGIDFDFVNNEKLKGSSYAVNGKTVNGYYDAKLKKIGLNIDSAKYLNAVVGHEVTHVFEGTDIYNALKDVVFEYAKTKGEFVSRRADLANHYKPEDIDSELVADLVGDYLFSDPDFIKNLSVKNRNVFQKIYDEIKYLLNVATAGSKEERQLEKVKHEFEKLYRESAKVSAEANPDNATSTGIQHSVSVTDEKTIDFLEKQDHITTYKAMQLIDGKLYPPMAAKVKGEDGKYRLNNPSELGKWQQATEDPTNIKKFKNGVGYYTLNKGNGKSVDAAYNPYEHSSNLVLNDQFEEAYNRDNIVTVECQIPVSEMTSGYKAEYAKDGTGVMDWKSGVVAGKIKDNKRKVYLSRWLKPVRILSDAETASMYKDVVGDISVPFNVVTPGLLTELEKAGVNIDYEGSPMYKSIQARKAEKDSTKFSLSLDKYSQKEYNSFGWAKDIDAVTSNEIDDMYSKIHEKGSLKKFSQSADGEAIIEVNDKPHTTLGANNTFLFVTGTENDPEITRVVKVNFFDEDSIEVFRKDIYENTDHRSLEAYARALGEEVIRYYDRNSNADYRAYTDKSRSRTSGRKGKGNQNANRRWTWRDGTFEETQSNDIAPVKETSSTDGVFFDGRKDIRHSLSDSESDKTYLDAVNRGDTETAQKMVDEVAKEAGYDTDAYHGTNQGDFTVFNWDKTQRADGGFFGRGHYFTKSEGMAKLYGDRIVKGKLKLGKTFVWSEKVNSYQGKKPPELLSRNIVSRINMAKLFPDIFANETMSYWEYDTKKGENIEKTIKWGELEGIVNGLSKELTLRAYADGTYKWHTEGRFWEVPVGESYSSVEKANEGKFFSAINALKEKYDGLLSAMTFDDQTTYTQQYGTEITETLKKNGYTSAMDTPEGGEIVVFDSNQVKSADPVTYDDNGNVIPLSERFQAENPDIRYSLAEENTYVPASDAIKYNLEAVSSHKNNLNKQYKLESSVELPELLNRYDKIVGVWEKLGGELDSKFLKEWNSKKGKDRSFSVFKAQAGYKYNVELSSMCKKGVPLFEAIDTIVKKEVMNELNTDVIGKAEKEILYDILKQHDFEIPCAICYVEQARQREGVIINDFLNGKDESGKLGWNRVLSDVQEEMAKNGVNYTFRNVDRSIATDGYNPIDEAMDEGTQEAFYSALQKMANEEIAKYNAETKEKKLKRAIRPKLKSTTPAAVKECFKGTLPANLKIFKTLFTEPSSRFTIDRDLLYSSMTTQNLASYHNGLYSLFNSQGGVSGYKTKQGTVVYWGDILNKKWDSSKLRNEGGVRNQSNSDFQMYTLLDQAQMYMDFTAKGYYLQAYTKVLSELKLFGLSRGKINASLIPAVKVYKNADGSVDVARTMENAGLDADGELLFDDIEGINHAEAFMLISDPEYSKNIGGICIGYSDNHIRKLLDDPRVQLIIGFHDKTNDPNKRYRGARYAKNYNGLNEAVNKDGETVHIGFNTYIKKAEKMFKYDSKTESYSGTATYNGMPYTANDIPRLAADIYLADCYKKGYTPAYNDFKGHDNYYKLLADFSLYDSNGQYAPHRKVAYEMPDQVPYLDENGSKRYMASEDYIKQELTKELKVRDAISEAMADRSEDGIIPQFIKRVNEMNSQKSLSAEGEAPVRYGNLAISGDDVRLEGTVAEEFSAPVREDVANNATTTPTISKMEQVEDIAPVAENIAPTYDYDADRFASLDDKDAPPVVDQPIQTVEERLAAKLQNTLTELANNRRLRNESNDDYEQEIARLQAEYDAKKKKDTRVANDILRRIERLRRMKGNIDADYAKRISDLEQKSAKMNSPEYKTAQQRMAKQDEYSSQMKELVGDTSTWVDKDMGVYYKVNTLRRNLRDIVRDENGKRDIAKADAIYDELQGKYNQHEASLNRESNQLKKPYADMKISKAEDTYIQMLGELRHNPDTTLTEDAVKEFYEKNKDKIDKAKVDKAIEMARKTYDGLLVRVNEVLREQGMKEIPYRQGYFPHFTDEKQGFLAKLFNWKTQNNDIPTDIAGLTENFNPNRSWQSFNKHRKGDTTDYSFKRGLDTYVHGALDWIYHIEDIQKRRALENYIRYTHSEKGVQDKIDAIRNNESYDADEMQEQIDLVYKEAGNPLNNFVTDLRAGTNRLANKKSSLDRSMEEMTNRKIYSTMTNLSNRVNANMVGGSISAALTNFIPITQSWGEVSPKSSLRAMRDTIKSTIRNDGAVDKSDFLTNRLKKEETLYKTTWDKIGDKVGLLMDAIDSFTSQTVWRSKYLENIEKGMSESEAIKNADQFAENVIGGRSRGNNPTVFDSKNPLVKALTAFQLEVNNQYGYMFKDMPQDVGNKSKAKLVKGYATMFLGAYAYNALYSSLTGRNAAFDPIDIIKDLLEDLGWIGDDEEEEPTDAFMNFAENIFEEVPFVGGLLGGGRIPISSALPYGDGIIETLSGTVQDFSDKDWNNLTKEWLKPLYYLAMPMGGGQLKKTIEGLSMFSGEHPIAGSYTSDGNLRFPVDDTLGSRVKAGLFGQWSSKNAQDYIEHGRQPLSAKQTQEFIDLEMPIQEYWEYREGLKECNTIAEKADYINSLDLQTWQKNIMINNLTDRKESIDMTDYDNYASYEEFDYASKNPEKYLVSKAVSNDFEAYQTYAKALSDITSDKDANGKTISNSRKTKVVNYLNTLNIDYGAKLILFKSEYNSDHTYNYEIIEYLNSRDDISYSEMEAILKELGFIVDAKGNIYW